MGFEQLSHDELVALYKAKNDGGRVPSRKAALIAALKRAGVEEADVEQPEEEEESSFSWMWIVGVLLLVVGL